MRSRISASSMAAALLLVIISAIPYVSRAQQAVSTFTSIPAFGFDDSGPVIRAHAEPQKPFTVAGEHGVLLGQQDGGFEAWVLPVKVLSHLTIEANIEGYTMPIDMNQMAAEIEVRPDRTIITFATSGLRCGRSCFRPTAPGRDRPGGALRV